VEAVAIIRERGGEEEARKETVGETRSAMGVRRGLLGLDAKPDERGQSALCSRPVWSFFLLFFNQENVKKEKQLFY
jgi:hypothetical protein